ncbi:MAG: OmpA family protein [Bacteroidota bacterium]
MKTTIKFLSLAFLLTILIAGDSFAQEKIENIAEGKYLVIGSFHIKKNAIGFTDYVRKMNLYNVTLAYDAADSYYRVYIKTYQGNEDGYDDVWRMRKETEFKDTWYMIVDPYGRIVKKEVVSENPIVETKQEQVTYKPSEKTEETIQNKQVVVEEVKEPTEKEWVKVEDTNIDNVVSPTVNTQNPEIGAATGTQNMGMVLNQPKVAPKTYVEEGEYKIYCNTYYTKNFTEIKGVVDVINPKTARLIRTARSLELLHVKDPNNGTHAIQLIANIFGYKKVQHDFILTDPFDSITMEFLYFKGDTLVANFPLRRYDQGDIATMYNVFFFKDAAIMKPNSIYELNSLLEMLRENDELKIKIHGHTNSNERGRIITLPEEETNFFSLNPDQIEEYGTAKELSLRRSEVIRSFLISKDIAADRMEVIGWGGKRPIYHKMDKLAIKNVRVEIEILEN